MAAEAVISFVIETLGDLILQKIFFLKGVQVQVQRLRDELVRMKCFLKDADQKQDVDERIRNWVSEIRCAAYGAEDVIEIFISKIESSQWKKGFLKMLPYKPMQWLYLNKVGKEIESIQARIKDIADSREKYGIRNLGEGTSTQREELQRLRRSFPFVEEKDVVGFDEKTKYLVAQLLKEDKRRRVVSVVGMGGVGKTTLAKKVYNHNDVRARFDHRAWACVSSGYNFRALLQTILKQVQTPNDELHERLKCGDEEELVQILYTELENKRYLVVLDDIWKEEDWDCLAKAFPDAGNAGRLLLTSRNQEVSTHADALSVPYMLKPLGPEDSWQLFLKKAISGGSVNAPSALEGIGRDITRQCGGLPLAISVIGGILLGKKNQKSEWERVLHNLSTYLSRNQNGVSAILELSYADLSPHLKFCFLYLGLFPEDHKISVRRLVHMWIAEGMIRNTDAAYLEEIAEDYLNQLINRNMVQVVVMSYDLKVKSCRIHDLLRELAKRKAKDENFFQINGLGDFQTSMKSRYVAVHCCSESSKISARSRPHLRSLIFIETGSYSSKISLCFTRFRLLRVLDLQDMNIKCLPKEIGKVIWLRYLNLRNTDIEKLPNSLSRLHNLQTLDISLCSRLKVSDTVWKLKSLQHIYMDPESCEVKLDAKELGNLQTLSRIDLDYLMHSDSLSLTSLRELGIQVRRDFKMDELCSSLTELGNFRSLNIRARYVKFPSLAGLSILRNITELRLSGELEMLPDFPPSLSSLSLAGTRLIEDPMPTLGKLRELSFLRLKMAYRGEQMSIPENGFLQLKSLELTSLLVKEIKVEKAAMPELRWLRINSCWDLKMLPEELKDMTALEKLELVNMPDSFVTRVEGEDSYKVCNVPTVMSFYYAKPERVLSSREVILEAIRTHAQVIKAAFIFAQTGGEADEA